MHLFASSNSDLVVFVFNWYFFIRSYNH